MFRGLAQPDNVCDRAHVEPYIFLFESLSAFISWIETRANDQMPHPLKNKLQLFRSPTPLADSWHCSAERSYAGHSCSPVAVDVLQFFCLKLYFLLFVC